MTRSCSPRCCARASPRSKNRLDEAGLTHDPASPSSIEAFAAIAKTLPVGSVRYEAEVDAKGERTVWLEEVWVDSSARCAAPARATPTSFCGSSGRRREHDRAEIRHVTLPTGEKRQEAVDAYALDVGCESGLNGLPGCRADVCDRSAALKMPATPSWLILRPSARAISAMASAARNPIISPCSPTRCSRRSEPPNGLRAPWQCPDR